MSKLLVPVLLLYFPMMVLGAENSNAANDQPASEAPSETKQTPPKNLLKPTADVESWQFELTDGGQGEMKVEDKAIVFTVTETTGTNWHVQAYQTDIPLKEGQQYVVKFKMRSPDYAEALLMALINEEDWHEVGLHENIYPEKEWKDYEFTFTANDVVEDNNRIGFVLGEVKGTTAVKDMTLTKKK